MKPMSPVLPGSNFKEVVCAKDQPQYLPLPSIVIDTEEGTVLTRWRLSFWERLIILWHGDLYHSQLAFHRPLQPIRMEVRPPDIGPFQERAAGGDLKDSA